MLWLRDCWGRAAGGVVGSSVPAPPQRPRGKPGGGWCLEERRRPEATGWSQLLPPRPGCPFSEGQWTGKHELGPRSARTRGHRQRRAGRRKGGDRAPGAGKRRSPRRRPTGARCVQRITRRNGGRHRRRHGSCRGQSKRRGGELDGRAASEEEREESSHGRNRWPRGRAERGESKGGMGLGRWHGAKPENRAPQAPQTLGSRGPLGRNGDIFKTCEVAARLGVSPCVYACLYVTVAHRLYV